MSDFLRGVADAFDRLTLEADRELLDSYLEAMADAVRERRPFPELPVPESNDEVLDVLRTAALAWKSDRDNRPVPNPGKDTP